MRAHLLTFTAAALVLSLAGNAHAAGAGFAAAGNLRAAPVMTAPLAQPPHPTDSTNGGSASGNNQGQPAPSEATGTEPGRGGNHEGSNSNGGGPAPSHARIGGGPALAIGPKQDDPAHPGRGLGAHGGLGSRGAVSLGPKPDDPSGATKQATGGDDGGGDGGIIGPVDSHAKISASAPGSNADMLHGLGARGTVSLGPKPDDPNGSTKQATGGDGGGGDHGIVMPTESNGIVSPRDAGH